MGITDQYIALLGADDEKVNELIEKMSEKTAKEMLKIVICKINKERRGAKEKEGFI